MLSVRFNCRDSEHVRLNRNELQLLWRCATYLSVARQHLVEQILRGGSNPEIAQALGIAVRTTSVRMNSLFQHVGVHSRAELISAVFAKYSKLIEVDEALDLDAAVRVYDQSLIADERQSLRGLMTGLSAVQTAEKVGRSVSSVRNNWGKAHVKFQAAGFDTTHSFPTLLHLIDNHRIGVAFKRFDANGDSVGDLAVKGLG